MNLQDSDIHRPDDADHADYGPSLTVISRSASVIEPPKESPRRLASAFCTADPRAPSSRQPGVAATVDFALRQRHGGVCAYKPRSFGIRQPPTTGASQAEHHSIDRGRVRRNPFASGMLHPKGIYLGGSPMGWHIGLVAAFILSFGGLLIALLTDRSGLPTK